MSRASAKDAWETRAAGVFATENGGRSWHEIYGEPALAIVRLTADAGVIETGAAPGPCMCTTRKLWTADDGETWHETEAIGASFAGSANSLYWWQGGSLHAISPFPPADAAKPLTSKVVASLPDGTIVAATAIEGGEAFLASNRVAGQNWDTDPRRAWPRALRSRRFACRRRRPARSSPSTSPRRDHGDRHELPHRPRHRLDVDLPGRRPHVVARLTSRYG